MSCATGVWPLSNEPMFLAVAVTIDSIMNPVFGTPTGTGGGSDGSNRDAHADRENIRIFGITLMLVDNHEAAGIGELLDAANGADAAKGGQHHRICERQFVGLADRSVVGDLFDGHFTLLNIPYASVGDPFDMLLAHLAFEQALGVADPVETEVSDIGLRGDKGHGHAIAKFAPAQLGFQNEQELVSRAEA
jgi:hypothetical protein